MVAMSPIQRTNHVNAGSPPSQPRIPDVLLMDPNKPSFHTANNNDTTLPSATTNGDMPRVSTSTTMTAQQEMPKASFSSDSSFMESSVEVTIVEEEVVEEEEIIIEADDVAVSRNNDSIPEGSYHLVTPARPDSVSTLGNMTYLQDSGNTMGEEDIVATEVVENEFYSARRTIAEVDDETTNSISLSPSTSQRTTTTVNRLDNSLHDVPKKSSSHSRLSVKVRTVEEDDDDSETTVSSDAQEEEHDLNIHKIAPSDTVKELQAMNTSPSTAATDDVDNLQESFAWDDEALDVVPAGPSGDSFDQSVDWGDSCSFEEVTVQGDVDDRDFEDTRHSRRSLISRAERESTQMDPSLEITCFCGRLEELEMLQNAVTSRMAKNATVNQQIFWISGIAPGIGKTALMKEFVRRIPDGPIICQGSHCEDFVSSPFPGIMACFRDLVDTLLSKELIGQWRSRIREVLRDDIRLLKGHIPSLTHLMDMNDPTDSPDGQYQERGLFQHLKGGLGRLLDCVCTQTLVVFTLDNLQWADEDSLRLIEYLLRQKTRKRFIFLGCHRRIKISHPLSRLKSKVLTESTTDVRLPELDPNFSVSLMLQQLNELKLQKNPVKASERLSSHFRETFNGNPLYSTQYLNLLHEKQALKVCDGSWVLDSTIRRHPTTEEVIAERVAQLSVDEQMVLQCAALLNAQGFNCRLLSVASIVLQESDLLKVAFSTEEMRAIVAMLERKKMLHRCSENVYCFDNQILQQVVFSNLQNCSKLQSRLFASLAHALLRDKLEDSYGDLHEGSESNNALIAYCFGKGTDAITTAADRTSMFRVCFQVSQDFASLASYAVASKMLDFLMKSLDSETQWKDMYKRSLKIHLALSSCLLDSGSLDKAKPLANGIIANAQTPRDKIGGYRILASIFRAKGQFDLSKNVVLKALEEIWNECLNVAQVDEKVTKVRSLMQTKSDTDLLIMDDMVHKKTCAKMPFLMDLAEVSGICQDFRLQDLAALRLVELTLQYGSFGPSFSSLAFAMCGICLGRRRLHGEAYRYGHLAETMAEVKNSFGRQAVTFHHYLLKFWKSSIRGSSEVLRGICKTSLEDLDIRNVSSQLRAYLSSVLVTGGSLAIDESLVNKYQDLKNANDFSDDWIVCLPYNVIMALTGKDSEKINTVGLSGTKAIQYDIFFQMLSAVFFQDMDGAAKLCSKLLIRPNGVYVPFGAFFEGLVSAHHMRNCAGKEKINHQKTATKCMDLLSFWASKSVPDVACLSNVLRAEIAIANEIQVSPTKAANLYDATIVFALDNTAVAALTSERAGLYFLSKNDNDNATRFLTRSLHFYQTWGAHGKVKHLTETYRDFVSIEVKPGGRVTMHDESRDLIDLSDPSPSTSYSVIPASQSITNFLQHSGDGSVPRNVQSARPSFLRASSDRAIGSGIPPTGRRDAFQRVASDRAFLTQAPNSSYAWPSPQQNHHAGQLMHPPNLHHYPVGFQPPPQHFGMPHTSYNIDPYFQQYQRQYTPGQTHPQPQYPFPSPNHQNHRQQPHHQISSQFHNGAIPVYPHQKSVVSQSLSTPPHFADANLPLIPANSSGMEIGSIPERPSSPKKGKKGKTKPIRSRSIPGRMPKAHSTTAGVSTAISKKETNKGTWAELKEDLHPKSFLKDMNFGKKKSKATKESIKNSEEKAQATNQSTSTKKERPSMALLPTWAVRSWSSGRRTSVNDEEKEAPVARRRMKSKNEDAKSGRSISPTKKAEQSKVVAGKSIEIPALPKRKKVTNRKLKLDIPVVTAPPTNNITEGTVVQAEEPRSPSKKRRVLKKMNADKVEVPVSPTARQSKSASKKNSAAVVVDTNQSRAVAKKAAIEEPVNSISQQQMTCAMKNVAPQTPNKAESAQKKSTTANIALASQLSPRKKKGASKKFESAGIQVSPLSPTKKKKAKSQLQEAHLSIGNPEDTDLDKTTNAKKTNCMTTQNQCPDASERKKTKKTRIQSAKVASALVASKGDEETDGKDNKADTSSKKKATKQLLEKEQSENPDAKLVNKAIGVKKKKKPKKAVTE